MTAPDVVVAVGTDHHRFDRVVGWADRWAAANPERHVFVQYGTSSPPTVAAGADLLPWTELLAMFEGAAAVVTHGGPATIMDARGAGRRPIVVARDPAHGEHVDNHQVLFSARMADDDRVWLAADENTFQQLLDRAVADRSFLAVDPAADDSSAAVARFAELVTALEQTPRRRWFGRPLRLDELEPGR